MRLITKISRNSIRDYSSGFYLIHNTISEEYKIRWVYPDDYVIVDRLPEMLKSKHSSASVTHVIKVA